MLLPTPRRRSVARGRPTRPRAPPRPAPPRPAPPDLLLATAERYRHEQCASRPRLADSRPLGHGPRCPGLGEFRGSFGPGVGRRGPVERWRPVRPRDPQWQPGQHQQLWQQPQRRQRRQRRQRTERRERRRVPRHVRGGQHPQLQRLLHRPPHRVPGARHRGGGRGQRHARLPGDAGRGGRRPGGAGGRRGGQEVRGSGRRGLGRGEAAEEDRVAEDCPPGRHGAAQHRPPRAAPAPVRGDRGLPRPRRRPRRRAVDHRGLSRCPRRAQGAEDRLQDQVARQAAEGGHAPAPGPHQQRRHPAHGGPRVLRPGPVHLCGAVDPELPHGDAGRHHVQLPGGGRRHGVRGPRLDQRVAPGQRAQRRPHRQLRDALPVRRAGRRPQGHHGLLRGPGQGGGRLHADGRLPAQGHQEPRPLLHAAAADLGALVQPHHRARRLHRVKRLLPTCVHSCTYKNKKRR